MKNVKGGEKIVQIQSEINVFELKSAVSREFAIPEEHQKLLYKGRILDDTKPISDYSIKDNDTVVLMSSYTPPSIPVPAANPIPEVPYEEEGEDLGVQASGTFNFLIGNPQFERIIQIIRNDPREFETFITQLEISNPELYDLINKNKKEFIELVRGKEMESDQLQLSPTEFRDVKELMGLGFSAQDSLEAYLTCGKNKEIAANFLFSGMN